MAEKRAREFVVVVPPRLTKKNYSVVKFSENLGVDVTNWALSCAKVRMEREDNRTEMHISGYAQEYGAGSEFGKAARDEARRKKYGRQKSLYKHHKQPWRLSIESTDGKVRRFRSISDAGAGEHADYWVFLKTGDGQFQAVKIDNWYQFLPVATHKILDIDQAEEHFKKRGRVLNQFALKAEIHQEVEEEGTEILETKPKFFKISDKDEQSSDGEGGGELSDSEKLEESEVKSKASSKKSNKNRKKPRKDKKQRVENSEDIVAYESDDGDDEGREYDYMSDSGTDSDRDNIPIEDKVEKALVAVGDESGLKTLINSDSEADGESDEDKKLTELTEIVQTATIKEEDEKDSSGSDSDDPDQGLNSVVFMQRATSDNDGEVTVKTEEIAEESNGTAKKRKADDSVDQTDMVKKIKIETKYSTTKATEGLSEAAVRKYLQRTPHTTKDLIKKFSPRCEGMSKGEIVTKLADILKRLSPHQYKQKQGKKTLLFFSLN